MRSGIMASFGREETHGELRCRHYWSHQICDTGFSISITRCLNNHSPRSSARPCATITSFEIQSYSKGCARHMAHTQRVPLKPTLTLAAKYVRMSTEHQQYSIDNQTAVIDRYAGEHHMEIVRTYVDSGKSGLTIENRPGLRQLIADVESGYPGFTAVLVYDVSRWGRFQDVDEGAFYEYRCRRAKIAL